jgi:hypothetical protein
METDIIEQIRRDFSSEEVAHVLDRLESATTSPRILRCIVFAARGHPWYFDFLCRQAKTDYRDVIKAAEYEPLGERLYDFNQPIPEARIAINCSPSPHVLQKK